MEHGRKPSQIIYRIPSIVSENKNRDKALNAKHFVKHLLGECVFCRRKYTPYVDFPLVYKSRSCPTCRPEQDLIRCPYKEIPNEMTKKTFLQALNELYTEGFVYPTHLRVFARVEELNKKKMFSKLKRFDSEILPEVDEIVSESEDDDEIEEVEKRERPSTSRSI